jgi:hypothetical protein
VLSTVWDSGRGLMASKEFVLHQGSIPLCVFGFALIGAQVQKAVEDQLGFPPYLRHLSRLWASIPGFETPRLFSAVASRLETQGNLHLLSHAKVGTMQKGFARGDLLEPRRGAI